MVQHAQLVRSMPTNTLDETVDTIGREIGLDQQEVAERMAFLDLRPDDLARLRELHGLAVEDTDTFSDDFYEPVSYTHLTLPTICSV